MNAATGTISAHSHGIDREMVMVVTTRVNQLTGLPDTEPSLAPLDSEALARLITELENIAPFVRDGYDSYVIGKCDEAAVALTASRAEARAEIINWMRGHALSRFADALEAAHSDELEHVRMAWKEAGRAEARAQAIEECARELEIVGRAYSASIIRALKDNRTGTEQVSL